MLSLTQSLPRLRYQTLGRQCYILSRRSCSPEASRPPENAAIWVLAPHSFPHSAWSFLHLLTAIGGPVQTKGSFPWQSEGNLSLELGMQSFILGQRSKPPLFLLHCERLFYFVPTHTPSVQGMGTVPVPAHTGAAGVTALKAGGTQSLGTSGYLQQKGKNRPEHSLCHVNYCFYLKFHWQSRKMPFRQSKRPVHGGLLESIK